MENKENASLMSKIVTVGFCVLLTVMMIGAFIYLSVCPDFVKPSEQDPSEPDDDSQKIWEYDMDDLLTYLDDEGFIEKDGKQLLSVIGTENWLCNGIDLAWWDVENLIEGTEEYEYWQSFQSDGFIIFGGSVYAPVFNGPFAIYATGNFPGDADALYEAFADFAQNYTPE